MIFTEKAVSEIKNKDGKSVFSKLGLDLGTMGWLGMGAVGGVMGGIAPLTAVASVGLLMKLPGVIRGISYVKNDVETFIPEYRMLLKDKYLKGHYEEQFKKLAIDYIENSESLLEKRFKAEFITEWLHSSQIYTFELKKSGFAEYSSNLKKTLIEQKQYDDRVAPTEEVDTGVTFGGYCEKDDYSSLQRKVYENFKDEGIVGNLIIRGGGSSHIDGLLALQDYSLTEVDQKVILEFLNLTPKEYVDKYMDKKISGIYFNQNSVELFSTYWKQDSPDKVIIANSILGVGHKLVEIQKYIKENNISLNESPVSTHAGFNVDLNVLTESFTKAKDTQIKLK